MSADQPRRSRSGGSSLAGRRNRRSAGHSRAQSSTTADDRGGRPQVPAASCTPSSPGRRRHRLSSIRSVLTDCSHWTVASGNTSGTVDLVEAPAIDSATTVGMNTVAKTVVEGGTETTSAAYTFSAYLGDYLAFVTVVTDPGSPNPATRSGIRRRSVGQNGVGVARVSAAPAGTLAAMSNLRAVLAVACAGACWLRADSAQPRPVARRHRQHQEAAVRLSARSSRSPTSPRRRSTLASSSPKSCLREIKFDPPRLRTVRESTGPARRREGQHGRAHGRGRRQPVHRRSPWRPRRPCPSTDLPANCQKVGFTGPAVRGLDRGRRGAADRRCCRRKVHTASCRR